MKNYENKRGLQIPIASLKFDVVRMRQLLSCFKRSICVSSEFTTRKESDGSEPLIEALLDAAILSTSSLLKYINYL